MRILSIHNSYQIRGGEDESRESEERLLREMGHKVEVYEVSNDQIKDLSPAQIAMRTIWSQDSYQNIQQQLQKSPHDIVHIQNFFPLISPAAHYAAKSQGVPVVQTLRNYRLLCPNALFFRNGQVCEDCLGKSIPYPGIIHRCYRDNMAASAGVTAMITVHRALKTWVNQVTIFIALSEFARQKFIEGGFPADKIVVKPNFVSPDPGKGTQSGGYALYVGRLSVEKGLDTLLDAWRMLKKPIPLKIIGDGPLQALVTEASSEMPHIEWLGRRPLNEVYDLIGEAMFLIFPSKWYETFGRVAIEAFAKGTPVIAANLGAIAELVTHHRTGLLFKPSDAQDLAKQIEWAIINYEALAKMRKNARDEYEQKYTADVNYKALINIYNLAQQKNSP
jgi:glycosyltransferase involved in cell wall biosynthesis